MAYRQEMALPADHRGCAKRGGRLHEVWARNCRHFCPPGKSTGDGHRVLAVLHQEAS